MGPVQLPIGPFSGLVSILDCFSHQIDELVTWPVELADLMNQTVLTKPAGSYFWPKMLLG